VPQRPQAPADVQQAGGGEDVQPPPEPILDLQPWLAAPGPAQPDGDGTTAGQPTGQPAPGKDGSGA
jgi:hypothetical protein